MDKDKRIADLEQQLAEAHQAIGLATTCVPDMEIDINDPIGMMRQVVDRLAEAQAELRRRGEWHHPFCRKMIYDIASSPCTCESEYNRSINELQVEVERLKSLMVNERPASALINDGMERAAEIAEKSMQHIHINDVYVADIDGRVSAAAIRAEIDK